MAASLSLIPFICFLTILTNHQATSQLSHYPHNYCFLTTGNNDDTYFTNLNTLLSKLTSNPKIDYGFYNLSYGQYPDTVYAIGLCRGDIKPQDCKTCLTNSTQIAHLCHQNYSAIAIHDQCLLYYDMYLIFGVQPTLDFTIETRSQSNITRDYHWDDDNYYAQVVSELLGKLSVRAAMGDSRRKFGAGNYEGKIYGVVQCMPDLNEPECRNCLERAISRITECCNGSSGGRVVKPTCVIRYENYRFFESTVDVPISLASSSSPLQSPLPSSPSPFTSTKPQGKHKMSKIVIAIVVPIVAFVVLLGFIWIFVRARKPRAHFQSEPEAENEINPIESIQFTLDTIKVATNSFSNANKLGQGGFGPVYKGRLSNGQTIAVKRLSKCSGQGDIEFKNEVLLMSKLQHRNLVRLLGFCLEGKERILVYEFLPNKSLDHFIFDPIRHSNLSWETRYKILVGIARGLIYLHEDSQQRIIHRDLKASNILLDTEMNPKISDFGMAKLFPMDKSQAQTERIVGTLGYMAPEYVRQGRFSVKSDVFSFGVLLLEIVSGQKIGGFHNGDNVEHLLSFAWKCWRKGTTSDIIDPTLKDGSRSEILKCIHIGLLCVQEKAANRPTLASVLLMLDSESYSLPVPLQPAFFMNNTSSSSSPYSTSSSDQNSKSVEVLSVNEVSISDLYPR